MQLFVFFFISFGWYSTALWIPEYFKRRSQDADLGMSIYFATFLTSAAQLPGNIASVFMVEKMGRRMTLAVSMCAGGLAALLFAAAPPGPVWSVTAGCIFNGVSIGGWNALDLYR